MGPAGKGVRPELDGSVGQLFITCCRLILDIKFVMPVLNFENVEQGQGGYSQA